MKPLQTADDIRQFCSTFNEGLRVEYKQSLDDGVRNKLPAIVASFANSLGGVLIIGVRTEKGVAQGPINGFIPPLREELGLTVENLCLQHINPPVLPRTRVLESDVSGSVFLIVEVDESWEAPHAIENSTRVYVRTGDSSRLYELATVDLIIELLQRRQDPLHRRNRLLDRAVKRANPIINPDVPSSAEASIFPSFPRQNICSLDDLWTFAYENGKGNESFFDIGGFGRASESTLSVIPGRLYREANRYGGIFSRRRLDTESGDRTQAIHFFFLIKECLDIVNFAAKLYRRFSYHGSVTLAFVLRNNEKRPMLFGTSVFFEAPTPPAVIDDVLTSERQFNVENLISTPKEVIIDVMMDIVWAYTSGQFSRELAVKRINQYFV